jgi:hypothetical protein
MGYTLVYEQNWSAGNSSFSRRQYYDRVANGADALYPEVNNAESVQVTTAGGPSGENTLDNWDGTGGSDPEPADDDYVLEGVSLWLETAATVGTALSIVEGRAEVSYKPNTKSLSDNTPGGYCPLMAVFQYDDTQQIFGLFAYPNGSGPTWTLELRSYNGTIVDDSHTFTPVAGTWYTYRVDFKRDDSGNGYLRAYVDGVLVYDHDPIFVAGYTTPSAGFPAYPVRTVWLGFAGLFGETTNFRLSEFAPASSNNLLTGSTHTVQGSDNVIAGAGGSVTGDKNAYFALCGSPAPLVADRTFKVCADEIIFDAPVITLSSTPSVVAAGTLAQMLSVQGTLTDAQIKALPTTPITLVAAPGAGMMLYPVMAFIDVKTTSGAYTNISDGAALTIEIGGYGNGQTIADDASLGLSALTDLIGVASRRFQPLGPAYEDILAAYGTLTYSAPTASVENGAAALRMYNTGGNLTGGHASNSMRVTLLYLVQATI